ncbi:MAG: cysteine rich repeat-containing protein [Hyphomicrobiaceae bacterium]
MRQLLVVLAILTTVALVSGQLVSANAQSAILKKLATTKAEAAVKKIKRRCSADVESYCPKVVPGEGRLALCIMAHENQISDKCYIALLDVADRIELALSNIWRAADFCEGDMDKFCSKLEPGEGRIAQCLIDNQPKLSSICRAEVAAFAARVKQ